MQQFKKDQQIPLTQVTDPNTGQVYYSPQNVVYNDKNGNGPQYLRNVIVDQATTASYFSGSITNAISASYAATASYLAGSIESASYAATASYLLGSVTSASYALSASYANYAETASSALNAQDILIYVKNQSGATIAKGVVVHITASGNSSDIPRVITASYENDNNSANTLGITNQSIANGAEGFVMTEGVLKGINTNAFQSGQLIYLGPTGSIIGYAPTAPLHSVRLGQVVREQSNNGSIYVRIDNGYELGELHDVVDTTTSSSYGDLLVKSGSVWTNSKQLTGSYAITGSLTATSFTASNATISGDVNILGTASINTLVVNQIGYSSGSNQLGDAANDTQTLFGTVRIPTGSLTVTGSTRITGSLNVVGQVFSNDTFISTAVYPNAAGFVTSGSLAYGTGFYANVWRGTINFPPVSFVANSYTSSVTNYALIATRPNTPTFSQFQLYVKADNTSVINLNGGGPILDIAANDTVYSRFDGTNFSIGTTSALARLHSRGTGTTSATTALRVENANASASFFVRDDGSVWSYGPKFISSNTTFGANAHVSLDSGSNNSAFGVNAGNAITNGTSNTSIGTNANRSLTLGNNNTAVGSPALFTNITGSSNSAIGANSLYFATSNNNTGVGVSSLYNTTTGDNNVGLGFAAVYLNTTGTAQTGVGYAALYHLNTGSNNTALGLNAGRYVAPSSSPLSSSGESIFIGVSSRANANGETNQIVIGYDANGIGSNSVVLGNNNITRTALKGSVGIGTISPSASLDVSGSGRFTNGLTVTGSVIATSFTGSLSGSVTSPGSTTQIIYNNGGVLGASSIFVFSGSRLGIGTPNPSDNLTVIGSTALYAGQTTITGATSGSGTTLLVRNLANTPALTITNVRSSSFNGNVDIAGDLSATNSSGTRKFQSGYFHDIHPEAANASIIPFYSNDLAYNTLRGGSVSASFGPGSTYTLNNSQIEALFDGSSNYCIMDPMQLSGSATFTITFPQSYLYSNIIGFSFGSTSWVARDFTVEILVTGSYVTLDTQTGYTAANYTKFFGYGVNAATGARITFSNFVSPTNGAGFRIAEIFLLNYNSQLGKAVFVGRDGGAIYKPITIQSGSTAAPSYSSLTDTNTGIYFPAADTLGFVEGGVEAMRINSSGQVGIGTTSQTSQLQVKGSGTTSATTALRVENANASASFVVRDNGSVGIGTAIPSVPLEVVGNIIVSGSQTIRHSFGTTYYDSSGYGGGRIFSSYNYANGEVNIQPSGSIPGNFVFSPNNGMAIGGWTIGGTAGSPPAYGLAVSGSIGIGTRVPTTQLDVSGSGRFTGNLTVTGSLIATSFTGSLQGTASYATTALSASFASTASYVNPLVQNVIITGSLTVSGSSTLTNIGPAIFTGSFIVNDGIANLIDTTNYVLNDLANGTSVNWNDRSLSDSGLINSIDWGNRQLLASNGASAIIWDVPNQQQAVEVRRAYFKSTPDIAAQYEFSLGQFNAEGKIITGATFTSASNYDFVYLDTSGVWFPVDNITDRATKMLGIAFDVGGSDSVLLEGHVTITNSPGIYQMPAVASIAHGRSIYVSSSAYATTVSPSSTGEYVRILGHTYYQNTNDPDVWIMNFRPDHSWTQI